MDWSGICIRPHVHLFEDRQGLSTVTSLYPVPLIYGKDKLGLLLINHSNKWFGNFPFQLTCNLSLNLFLSFKPGEQSSADAAKALSHRWPNTRRGEWTLVRTWSRDSLGGRLGNAADKNHSRWGKFPSPALSKGCAGNYKFDISEIGRTWLYNLKNVFSRAYIMQYRLLKANQIQIRSYFPSVSSFPSSNYSTEVLISTSGISSSWLTQAGSRKRLSFYHGSQGKAVGLAHGPTVVFISLCTAVWRPCLKGHLPQQGELNPDQRSSGRQQENR